MSRRFGFATRKQPSLSARKALHIVLLLSLLLGYAPATLQAAPPEPEEPVIEEPVGIGQQSADPEAGVPEFVEDPVDPQETPTPWTYEEIEAAGNLQPVPADLPTPEPFEVEPEQTPSALPPALYLPLIEGEGTEEEAAVVELGEELSDAAFEPTWDEPFGDVPELAADAFAEEEQELLIPDSIAPAAVAGSSAVQVLQTGIGYFLKIDLDDSRVHPVVTLANNNTGGRQSLSGIAGQFSGRGYADWVLVNADLFSGNCPSGVNCGQGLTYTTGQRRENWSAYGNTWQGRGNIGFDSGNDVEISVGDSQGKRHMTVAGGPRIVMGGGAPTCSGQLETVGGATKTFFPASGEWFDDDVTGWCSDPRSVTLVGYSSDKKYLYVGVSHYGQTVIQVADWLKSQGAHEILRFDSGGSSGIIHNGQRMAGSTDRAIPSALAIVVDAGGPTPEPTEPPTPTPLPTDPPPPPSDGVEIVGISSHEVNPGEQFNPSVTIRITNGQLLPSRGDHLHAVPEDTSNTMGAWPVQAVKSSVGTGGTYTFDTNNDTGFRMTAPQTPGNYVSRWRLRVGGNHIGPEIVFHITVRGSQPPPNPSGWRAQYWNGYFDGNPWGNGRCRSDEYTASIPFTKNWGSSGPGEGCSGERFSVLFERRFDFVGGRYRFHCHRDGYCRIFIPELGLTHAEEAGSFAGMDYGVDIPAGNWEVKIEYSHKRENGDSRLEFWWQGPTSYLPPLDADCNSSPYEWCARYRVSWQSPGDSYILRRLEGSGYLDYNWGDNGPGYGIYSDFSADWSRLARFDAGLYRFHVVHDDGVRISVDGNRIVDQWNSCCREETADIWLTEGDHRVFVDWYDSGGGANLKVWWEKLTSCYTLNVTKDPADVGGNVELSPPPNCPTDGGKYIEGTNVAMTAYSTTGNKFFSWFGDVTSTEPQASIVVNSDKRVIARYMRCYTLQLDSPSHGSITQNMAPNCNDGTAFTEGATVLLSAVPDNGYRFEGWSGAITGMENPVNVTMDANKSVAAAFAVAVPSSKLIVSASPANQVHNGLAPISTRFTFRESAGTAVTIQSYSYRWYSADGSKALSSTLGPMALDRLVNGNGSATWSAGLYLPQSVVKQAADRGENIVRMYFVFRGIDTVGRVVSAKVYVTMQLASCGDAAEPNNGTGNATALSFGQTVTGVLCPSGELDLYTFYGAAGDRIRIAARLKSGSAPLDPRLELLASDGSTVLATNDNRYSGETNARIGMSLPTTGRYYVRVTDAARRGGPGQSYDLLLHKDNGLPVVAIRPFAGGNWLHARQQFIRVMAGDRETEIDRVVFYARLPGVAERLYLGADFTAVDGWYIYWDTSRLATGQGYMVLAYAYDGAGNSRAVALTNLGLERTPPTVKAVTVALYGDAPFRDFLVNWKNGQDTGSGISSYDVQVRKGTTGAWTNWVTNTTTVQARYIGDINQTYYFRARARDKTGMVSALAGGAGDTQFTVLICAVNQDAYEADDSAAAARAVRSDGSRYRHNIHAEANSDWIKFTATAGMFYTLQTYSVGKHADTVLILYQTNGSTVLTINDDYAGAGGPSQIVWQAPTGGTYYARVAHHDRYAYGCTTTYDVAVTRSATVTGGDAALDIPSDDVVDGEPAPPGDALPEETPAGTVGDWVWNLFLPMLQQ